MSIITQRFALSTLFTDEHVTDYQMLRLSFIVFGFSVILLALSANDSWANGCSSSNSPVSTAVTGPCNISGTNPTFIVTPSGSISSTTNGIDNSGTTPILTNSGAISGSNYGINNTGTIATLSNAQGGNGLTPATTALSYTGILANNYNIIINSTTYYGQLSVTSVTGNTIFGIDGGSTVAAGTYADVLQGFSDLSHVTGTSGTYSGLSYRLVADNLHAGDWNLLFASNMLSGGTYQTSDLGNTVNPKFDGGTLQISSAGIISAPLTITSNNGTIDQHGLASIFSGAITDDVSGVAGKLTIENTGTANQGSVTLSGTNTYSGGTQVNSGANLSITTGSALGSGTLALVGSPTTAATLSTTASTTIANAITVSGDPIFNVAAATTTTVSGVIADGVSPGDVGVYGGGTLNLTNTNTYTGSTTISSGSTLALSGAGSIADSHVSNLGTFNIQNTANNVSVAGFSQASSGLLAMSFSPSHNQELLVNGTTSLAGGLSLAAAVGRYAPGHYTLLNSTGLLSGHFSNVVINSLANYTNLGYLLSYDTHDVYLNLLPNLLNTQTSLQANVAALQGVYALQTGTVNNSLNYDCNNFGSKGFCVSTGGRYSNASESTANTTSAMIIAGYRINDHLRIGASADQNLYNTDVAQIASLQSNTPLMAAFVIWNQHADKTGFETKLAAAYNNSDLHVNRTAVGTSESGQGSTTLNTLSESMTTSYAFKLGENYLVSPYAGVRHTSVSANGYSEHSTANVTSPLSYNGLNQESTSALLGVRLAGQIYKNTTIQTSAGFEEDMQNSVNNYSATGLAGLSAITFNPSIQRTRAVASFGASYELAKGHRISFNTIYRQESFQGVDTKMAYVNYSMEF